MRKKGQDSLKTRDALLRAALELISERGYLGATTREIARRADVTEITLFRHFGSKERLFEEVLHTYTFLPRLRELLPSLVSMDYEEALYTVGTRFFETLKERKTLVKIMLSEINIYPDKIRNIYMKFINEMIETLAGYFKSLQRKGIIREFDPSVGARAFLGMIFSFFQAEVIVRQRSISKKRQNLIIREFADIFVKGTRV